MIILLAKSDIEKGIEKERFQFLIICFPLKGDVFVDYGFTLLPLSLFQPSSSPNSTDPISLFN